MALAFKLSAKLKYCKLADVDRAIDSHISRIDLVGKDAIVLNEGRQVTEFRDGILPWALQRNVALVFDEYRRRPARRDVRDPARA